MSRTEMRPLGELCAVRRDAVAPDSAAGQLLPYVGLEQIESGSGRIRRGTSTSDADVASVTFRFGPTDVLYGKLRPYLNKVALPDFEGRCSTEILPLVPTERVSRRYLALLLRSERVLQAAQKSSVGSRMPRADLTELLRVLVPVPDLHAQQRMVALVDTQMDLSRTASKNLTEQVELAEALPGATMAENLGPGAPVSIANSVAVAYRTGWKWHPLTQVARLESGHTPSRRRPEWWGGDVPWLALPDIRKLHGLRAHHTVENTNDAGLANSSARLLPVDTVCMSRTASVGFVTILGRPMATSQDFCNWVCDATRLDPDYLMYAVMASQESLRELSSGAVHKSIYMPTLQSFHVLAPDIVEQRRIAALLRERLHATATLLQRLRERQADIARLPQRLLAAAFAPQA